MQPYRSLLKAIGCVLLVTAVLLFLVWPDKLVKLKTNLTIAKVSWKTMISDLVGNHDLCYPPKLDSNPFF